MPKQWVFHDSAKHLFLPPLYPAFSELSMRVQLLIASFSMFLAIALGALGAHALAGILSPVSMDVFHTAVQYHVWHSLAVLVVHTLPEKILGNAQKKRVGWLMIAGIILFSFSLYALATKSLTGIDSWSSWLGPLTPIGGLCFIAAWLLLALAILRKKSVESTL